MTQLQIINVYILHQALSVLKLRPNKKNLVSGFTVFQLFAVPRDIVGRTQDQPLYAQRA